MKSYSILENPIRLYRIIWDGYGILEGHEMTPQYSVKFLTVKSYKILQDITGS